MRELWDAASPYFERALFWLACAFVAWLALRYF